MGCRGQKSVGSCAGVGFCSTHAWGGTGLRTFWSSGSDRSACCGACGAWEPVLGAVGSLCQLQHALVPRAGCARTQSVLVKKNYSYFLFKQHHSESGGLHFWITQNPGPESRVSSRFALHGRWDFFWCSKKQLQLSRIRVAQCKVS